MNLYSIVNSSDDYVFTFFDIDADSAIDYFREHVEIYPHCKLWHLGTIDDNKLITPEPFIISVADNILAVRAFQDKYDDSFHIF